MDYRLALMCGTDIVIESCRLVVHQPRISEIALIGDTDFFIGAQCLCVYESMFVEDKKDLLNINNFQIFMMIMQEKQAKDKKQATKKTLSLLFPNYSILFTPNSLLFKSEQIDEDIIVDENNFEDFQEVLRGIFCMKHAPMDQTAFNPAGERARKIAEKIMRGREKIAAEKDETNSNILVQYISALAVGLHMPLSELVSLTLFQLYDLIERMMLNISWDQYVRTCLAGGKPENTPDNWMKNIH